MDRERTVCRRGGWTRAFAGIACLAATVPAFAQNFRVSASASATETYTSNVNYSGQGPSEGDFATSLSAGINVSGGNRFRLNGAIGATAVFYAKNSENNNISFTPNVSLAGTLEAIDNFAYVDLQANISPQFATPFGPQPNDLANVTNNRYVSQTYAVSPYIKGRIPGSNVSYQVRNDNYWTFSSQFGGSSPNVPTTFSSGLNASMNSPSKPLGWTLEYSLFYYGNGVNSNDVVEVGQNVPTSTTQSIRLLLPYQIDPQLQITPRIGYESNRIGVPDPRNAIDSQGTIYGIGGQWNPTDRTQVSGYWEHRFFGSSYSAQVSHRLPNASISGNFSRGLSSYPQLALAIPAGATVAQFVDAAFTTRIPDPAERAAAVAQFLAQTGLPPSLTAPVNFYGASLTLQQSANISLVLIGTLNSVTFSVFNVNSEALSGTGSVLPPALQFGQNNTQTGVGIAYSHRLSGFTNFGASANFSKTKNNATEGAFANARSNNSYVSASLSTQLGAKTSGSAGMSYSKYDAPENTVNFNNSSSLNVFAGVSHTF